MANIEIAATTGRQVVLHAHVIEQFRTGRRGGHLFQGDEGYDAARKIYNAMIDHRPAIIARCAGVADVIDAVNFARSNDLLVSVRGGGHNVSGNALCDGGLMIDLSAMKSVRVDPEGKTADCSSRAILGTRISSGGCAGAAEISALPPPLNSAFTRWGQCSGEF
jgi:hypothetical protein